MTTEKVAQVRAEVEAVCRKHGVALETDYEGLVWVTERKLAIPWAQGQSNDPTTWPDWVKGGS